MKPSRPSEGILFMRLLWRNLTLHEENGILGDCPHKALKRLCHSDKRWVVTKRLESSRGKVCDDTNKGNALGGLYHGSQTTFRMNVAYLPRDPEDLSIQ